MYHCIISNDESLSRSLSLYSTTLTLLIILSSPSSIIIIIIATITFLLTIIITIAVITIMLQKQKHIWKQRDGYYRIIILSTVRINRVKKLQLKMEMAKPKVREWGNIVQSNPR